MFLIASIGLAVRSSGQDQQGNLIKQLASTDVNQRMEAFEKLRSSGIASDNKELKDALLDLLDRENQLIEATLRESNGKVGASAKYGEGYSEYVGWLAGTVLEQADLADKRTLSILLRTPYHPTSHFASTLLKQGDAVVPILVEISNSDVSIMRAEATQMLGLLIEKHRSRISKPTVELIRQALNQRLYDEELIVRKFATESLRKVRD